MVTTDLLKLIKNYENIKFRLAIYIKKENQHLGVDYYNAPLMH